MNIYITIFIHTGWVFNVGTITNEFISEKHDFWLCLLLPQLKLFGILEADVTEDYVSIIQYTIQFIVKQEVTITTIHYYIKWMNILIYTYKLQVVGLVFGDFNLVIDKNNI